MLMTFLLFSTGHHRLQGGQIGFDNAQDNGEQRQVGLGWTVVIGCGGTTSGGAAHLPAKELADGANGGEGKEATGGMRLVRLRLLKRMRK